MMDAAMKVGVDKIWILHGTWLHFRSVETKLETESRIDMGMS